MQILTVLGATGSIGVNTLDVVRRHPDRYRIHALTAHRQVDRLLEQCIEFRPRLAVLADHESARTLTRGLAEAGLSTEVWVGPEALEAAASQDEVTTVMAAIVGAAGLAPALAAARTGKRVLLANKEALVMAGPLFMAEIRKNGAVLLPIDSEHNAIFQSLPINFSSDLSNNGVTRVVLTASGGPFRAASREALRHVTPAQACAHPNWIMGRKISVDSATLMNKGLEVIEARWLFNIAPSMIDVVVHPQSVIHSMVQYVDGSVIAELGNPDMRTPIAHALAFPERIAAGVGPLDLIQVGQLTFEAPDPVRFPCLDLAYRALAHGDNGPTILNAANEIAVDAFLSDRLPFLDISTVVAATLDAIPAASLPDLPSVFAVDALARAKARQFLTAD